MATATQENRAGPQVDPRVDWEGADRGEYRCECGHMLRVFGGGRHRVFFEPESTRSDDPVMNRACPGCGRRLPGKGRPYAGSDAGPRAEEES